MKTISGALSTHLQGEVTSLATCWLVTRTDGTSFHFTDHDTDLDIDIGDGTGTNTYESSRSYNRSAIQNNDSLAVDNLELTGVLASDAITENDLRRGLFDFAEISVFLVNHQDLSQGIIRLRKGWLGEVVITPSGLFQAELRGLTQAYARRVGELYTAECRADLGDSRCKIPILPDVAARGTTYAVGDFVRASSSLETVPNSQFHMKTDAAAEDVSENAATLTIGSETAFQTIISRFGAGSLEFSPTASVDPTNAVVTAPDISAYTIGSQPFTIEGHVRFKDLTATEQVVASHFLSTGDERAWYLERNAGNLEFAASTDGISMTTISGAFSWSIDTWYHVAVTRDASNDVRLFVDGTQVGSTTSFSGTIIDPATLLRLGALRDAGVGDRPLDGFLDQVRITIGTALYTSNFTAPSAAFSTISETIDGLLCPDFDDRIYQCTTAGVSDTVIQPSYDTVVGNTTTDGSAVFTSEEAWSRCITVTAVDVTEPRKKFTVTELTPNSGGTTAGRDFFPDNSMDGGLVVWETGNNALKAMEIRDFTADDGVTIEQDINLLLDMAFDIEVGDTARVYRGCAHRLTEDCKNIFNNVINFRGEPYIPGQDQIYDYPDAKS